MEDNLKKTGLEQLLDEVDFSGLFVVEEDDEKQVGLWIPEEYKKRFDSLQSRSKKKFGKLLKGVVMKCIERAESADPKAS